MITRPRSNGRPRPTKSAAATINKPLPLKSRNETAMNPNNALDTVSAALANSPDSSIASPLIAALRILLARTGSAAASQQPVNLTSHLPRPDAPADAPADALAQQIASLRRDATRAVSRGDTHEAERLGRQLAGLERQLASAAA